MSRSFPSEILPSSLPMTDSAAPPAADAASLPERVAALLADLGIAPGAPRPRSRR